MATNFLRVTNVFVPGGIPQITYISREEHQLEAQVSSAKDNLSKLLVVTGPTKSGKTVLVDRLFPRDASIWVDGGAISDEESFWDCIIEKASLFTSVEESNNSEFGGEASGELSAEGGIFVAKGSATLSAGVHAMSGMTSSRSRVTSSKIVAVNALQTMQTPLIVDDFHYINKDVQKAIVRALKSPIMHGLPVIFIAIPNRKYDSVEVEREMTGRIENVEMPIWSRQELANIAQTGFRSLNIAVKQELIDRLTSAAYGSPFLMQEFCKELCLQSEIAEKTPSVQYISEKIDESEIFKGIAEHSGRSMFDKLKRGPRARTDRKPRRLRNGTTTDIYGVVMEALKNTQPGVETIPYDTLRANIRSILDDDLPQKHEISRVLDKIAEISYTDASSTPVIDWQRDDDILTITDPFFAFYLKWA